jgi:replicative DNA helicase
MQTFTDLEAERRVLSSMMHSETACIESIDLLHEDEFAEPLNRQVFLLLESLYIRGTKATYVEVLKEGYTLGFLAKPKNIEDLKYIAEHYIDDKNIKYWIEKVKQAAKAREAQSLVRKCVAQMKDGKIDIDRFVADTSSEFFALAMDTQAEKVDTPAEIADLGIKLVTERVEKYRQMAEEAKRSGQVPMEGVPTGFKTLDNMTLGLKPGDLAILGAQTGHGKTAFAMNVAKAACVDAQNNILYINTEMSKEQIARRWGSILSSVALYQLQSGSLTNEQQETVVQAYSRLKKSGFYSYSIPNLTPQKLDVLARKHKLQQDIKLVILDYVGRMEKILPDMSEWQVLEQIIKSMKLLAQNLQVACLVLVQLNPDGTLQGAKRMENECDLMLKLIPVPEDGQKKIEERLKKLYEEFNYRIFVQKARDAESGRTIPVVFAKELQQIREARESKTGWEAYGKAVDM